MRNQIIEDMKQAMKNQDKETLAVIKMVKGAMQLKELDLKRELNDEEVLEVIAKQIKMRNESLAEFEKANRTDLLEQTKKEIEILDKYMPEMLSEEEIDNKINEAFENIKPEGMKDMGKIMSELNSIKAQSDMSLVSKKVREKLSNM